jgi:putative ABC transport system permease protein
LSVGAVVIGVVKDYHYRSLEAPIEPVLLHMEWGLSMALVKLSPGGLRESIDRVGKAWKDILPDVPFSYSFLDEDLAKQYTSYKRWLNVMGFSTAFAIIISCLGLFGLAGINAVNRTKEMGIRKVMGADMSNIFVLLNRQYIVFSLIAFSVAIPLSYYAMNRWLSDFKFRIEMGWEIFGISILIGLAVALLTVSYHGLKAGLVNPAETLKYE